jgi:aromatic ring hydroxylase
MPLKTPEQYRQSLRDDRTVYFRGQRVKDVTTHPILGVAVDHAAIDYRLAEEQVHRGLAVARDPETGHEIGRHYVIPRSADDLLKRSQIIDLATREGATLVTLIKEIGTDGLFALHVVASQMDAQLGTRYLERVQRFYRHCADGDLAVAVAQTDVKGDRSLRPSEQEHPDYYVRAVSQRKDGIVVRGCKVHTSIATNANEIIVLPTRNLDEADKDYAVAFAVPVNTPGVKLIASPYGSRKSNAFENPLSTGHKMMETMTVFDDVFVPWERVFMNGEWQFAGPLALGFVEFHRFTAVSYKLPLLDLLVGAAALLADYNGVARAAHVRDKFVWLITYAETVRWLTKMSALECRMKEGIAVPNPLISNIAKFRFAEDYHKALQHVQDIAGGLLVTAPAQEDLENPETAEYIRHYLGGRKGVSADNRLRALNMVSDLTTADFGGYQAVLAVHAEGSLEAEKLTIFREYDVREALAYAKKVAGIQDKPAKGSAPSPEPGKPRR